MWVEELKLENVRCFESVHLRFSRQREPYRWVTLLGENSGGKSTILQALALLLAGPEGAVQLVPRPVGWVRHEDEPAKVATHIHQGERDPGQYGDKKVRHVFGYSYAITGGRKVTVNQRVYTEPAIIPAGQRVLSWLRENALVSKGEGWFAAGYGAFRRLTRSSQVIVPSLQPQARFTNFMTQFNEDEALATFERWIVYLDYRISKEKESNPDIQKQWNIGVAAINKVLPPEVRFHGVTSEGRILFDVAGERVSTLALSDGYRSVLALTGDLVWRLMQAFPKSEDPLGEEGVVLIDELDIHLHPKWQRTIAGWLRALFPNLQFIVATHSPLLAAGAGQDALTLRCRLRKGGAVVEPVPNVAAFSVDRILQSEAFELVSPFSPETQQKIDRYDRLARVSRRSRAEEDELQMLLQFMDAARPFGGPPKPGSLAERIDSFLDAKLHD